jgi:hypothetical protein
VSAPDAGRRHSRTGRARLMLPIPDIGRRLRGQRTHLMHDRSPVSGAGDDGSGSCWFVQSPFCLISIMRQVRRRRRRLAADGDGTPHPVMMACGHWPRLPGSTSASSRPGHRAAPSVACQNRSSAIRARRWRLSRRGRVAGASKISGANELWEPGGEPRWAGTRRRQATPGHESRR